MILAALVISAVFFYLKFFRGQKRVASIVHVQERTEEAETLDFTVTLFEDESPGAWEAKIYKVIDIAERRREYNNERMTKAYEKMQASLKPAPAPEN